MSIVHLSEIFSDGYDQMCERYGHTPLNDKVAHAITSCRTELLGGHLYQCQSCQDIVPLYNSCNNRHCPQCQSLARQDWVEARECELLPVPYFHAVFTIPSELNPFVLRNKKTCYSILFRSVNETLQELGNTSKYLGASIGFIAVLHTWGQNLMDHPHIHCIVPAGGLSKSGKNWIACKNFFLFPFKVMKKLFSGKVLAYFKEALENGTITLSGSLEEYKNSSMLKRLFKMLYKKKWVIFVKQPFASPLRVIQYLGNYTHRIAISESRITSFKNGTVTFAWKDYADDSKEKQMPLDTVEFIRRFLLHVLPKGFMRIRHYGFLSNSNRIRNREQFETIFASLKQKKKQCPKKSGVPWNIRIKERTGKDPLCCKKCGKGSLMLIEILNPVKNKDAEYVKGS
jgi:hypothetical protein